MNYIPIIKTTQAELKGFDMLSEQVKGVVTPLFELTKGRTHKDLYPEGRIEIAFEKALETSPIGKFILDLTAHEDLINSEIEHLFDGNDGYQNWCDFIANTGCKERIIPIIQIDGDQLDSDVSRGSAEITLQAQKLENMCGQVAFRVNLDIEPDEVVLFVQSICDGLVDVNNLTLIIDAEYVKQHTSGAYVNDIYQRIEMVKNQCRVKNIAICASSFPKTVTESGYGGDFYGNASLEEVELYQTLKGKSSDINWIYSDYALIHPVRYDVRGGTWIPRIDIPLSERLFYYRMRRQDGGYAVAARDVYIDPDFQSVPAKDSWGYKEVETAATSAPTGRSPAHWIAVRSNIHITNQAIRLGLIS